jgi:hypothetical protein
MNAKCNGCGLKDAPTAQFRCAWPDKHITFERYCNQCRVVWTKQLKALGATLEELNPTPNTPNIRRN